MQYIDSHENECTKNCLKELAEILARGYLRLKKRTSYIPELTTETRQQSEVHDRHLHASAGEDSSPVYRETT